MFLLYSQKMNPFSLERKFVRLNDQGIATFMWKKMHAEQS